MSIIDITPQYSFIEESLKHINLSDLLKEYKYSNLFYKKYRCGLVHEARVASFDFDLCQGNYPYYVNYTDIINDKDKKHLIFPVKFILDSTKNIIKKVKNWLIQQNINPYERYNWD